MVLFWDLCGPVPFPSLGGWGEGGGVKAETNSREVLLASRIAECVVLNTPLPLCGLNQFNSDY